MPTSTWKSIEAKVAAVFGLKRRGADYGDRSGGKTDATNVDGTESERWALECKHGKRITWGTLADACRQVEAAALPGQEPVVVAHKHGTAIGDSLVVMRLETFAEWRLSDADS